jgi:hypothetical protein
MAKKTKPPNGRTLASRVTATADVEGCYRRVLDCKNDRYNRMRASFGYANMLIDSGRTILPRDRVALNQAYGRGIGRISDNDFYVNLRKCRGGIAPRNGAAQAAHILTGWFPPLFKRPFLFVEAILPRSTHRSYANPFILAGRPAGP